MSTKNIASVVDKFMMLTINVSNMQKAREFYAEKLGLKILTDFRVDDNNWWVTLTVPGGGANITLARTSAYPENIKPGTLTLYFATSNVCEVHRELSSRSVEVNVVRDDLFGPGSGVKFFNLHDPDGNLVHVVQEHETRIPF